MLAAAECFFIALTHSYLRAPQPPHLIKENIMQQNENTAEHYK
jgi:hypothetical protein